MNEQNHKLDPDAKSIEEIALRTWYEHLFTHLNEKVSTAAIRMLRRNRDGQEINSTALNAVIESYIDLGFREWANDLDDSNHLSVCFVTKCIQIFFLRWVFEKFECGLLKMLSNYLIMSFRHTKHSKIGL